MTVIEVTIGDIVVDGRWYSFDYVVKINGIEKGRGEYQSDHVWEEDPEGLVAMLEAGEAVKHALDEVL